jgi:hypothetical protein
VASAAPSIADQPATLAIPLAALAAALIGLSSEALRHKLARSRDRADRSYNMAARLRWPRIIQLGRLLVEQT